tara:strand:+ start:751 stop:939 length:189 start_codon:yes stop_codon:yes gene_type:complete
MSKLANLSVNQLCQYHNYMKDMIDNPRDCDYQNFNKVIADIKEELINRKQLSEYVLSYRGKL